MSTIKDKPKRELYDWEIRPFTQDRIRDGMVAELVFGWVWREREIDKNNSKICKALHPQDDNLEGWKPCNYAPDWFRPAKPETEPFLDWDNACILYNPDPKRDWEVLRSGIPHFSTDAGDDCSVLVKIRKILDVAQQTDFEQALHEIWSERNGAMTISGLCYEIGDYSKAAIAVFRKNHPDHPAFDPKRVYVQNRNEQ